MQSNRFLTKTLLLLATVGMITPRAVLAAPPNQMQASRPVDVKLGAGGLLLGQVVNPQGRAVGDTNVVLAQSGKQLVAVRTDQQGRFAIKGLRSGMYQVASSTGAIPVRVWSAGVEPPQAVPGVMVVEGEAVRGQCSSCSAPGPCDCATYAPAKHHGHHGWGAGAAGHGGGGGFLGGGLMPWVVGAGVAAAIAIPVALSDDDDDNDAS